MKALESCSVLTEADMALLNRAVEAIREHLPDAKIILYGSRARGEAGEESDYDLLAITSRKPHYKIEEEVHGEMYDIFLETDQYISVIVMHTKMWNSSVCRGSPFYAEVSKDGIVLC